MDQHIERLPAGLLTAICLNVVRPGGGGYDPGSLQALTRLGVQTVSVGEQEPVQTFQTAVRQMKVSIEREYRVAMKARTECEY